MHRDVADALADLGYFFAKFNLDVEADAKTKTARLAIDILDEGPRAVLGDIEVTGNKVNSRDDIVKYLGLQPGEPGAAARAWTLATGSGNRPVSPRRKPTPSSRPPANSE